MRIGYNYFERSRNPVVRAHATLRLYDLQKISIIELADGIMRDCIQKPHGGILPEPLSVYKGWFMKHPLSDTEKSSLSLALDGQKLTITSRRVVLSLFSIKKELGLF